MYPKPPLWSEASHGPDRIKRSLVVLQSCSYLVEKMLQKHIFFFFLKALLLATSTSAGGLARSLLKAHSSHSSKWTQISRLHMEVLCVPSSKSFLQGLGPCRDQELDLMRIMHRRSWDPIPSQLQFITSDKVRAVQHGTKAWWLECPFLVCVCVWRCMCGACVSGGQRSKTGLFTRILFTLPRVFLADQ